MCPESGVEKPSVSVPAASALQPETPWNHLELTKLPLTAERGTSEHFIIGCGLLLNELDEGQKVSFSLTWMISQSGVSSTMILIIVV